MVMRLPVCLAALVVCVSMVGRAQTQAPRPVQGPSGIRIAAEPAATVGQTRLAVRRVVLYKNGVGFFEHTGRVTGDQDVTVTFTSAQLDDALKSLTALDLGKGQIAGITYNSTAPLAQRLANVSFRLGEKGDRAEFFRSMRGARLEVRTASGVVRGRLLSVDQQDPVYGSSPDMHTTLMLASDTGQVTSLPMSATSTVKLLDRDISSSVTQYLETLADEHRRDERRVSIASRGTGARDLYVSYISEVPVWKSTYRLLMPGEGRPSPILQGWAVVDNTVGEDWVDVEMALVAGAPQSFVQRLSQPHYLRRPVVQPPMAMQMMPQTHDTGTRAGVGGGVSFGLAASATPPPAAMVPRGLAETITVTGASPAVDTSSANFSVADLEDEMAEQLPAATGRAVGELFEYRLSERVTVRKNQSALVPIVRASIQADRVSIWNDHLGTNRPLRAVWLTNTSGYTLDGGTISIVDGGSFAGEGTIEPLVPGEKRLVSFARDLSTAVTAVSAGDRRVLVSLRSSDGQIVEQRETCARRTYIVRNDDRAARTLVIEHPVRSAWKLVGEVTPVESTPAAHRFQVAIAPGATETLVVQERHASASAYAAATLTEAQVAAYASGDGLGTQAVAWLSRLVELRQTVAEAESARVRIDAENRAIAADQQRLRQNMGVLKGTAEERQLLQRYIRQMSDHENRLQALSQEAVSADARTAIARATFDAAVKALAIDAASAGTTCR
jgi:hypothetical protein